MWRDSCGRDQARWHSDGSQRAEPQLGLVDAVAAGALRHNLSRVLIESPRLWNRFYAFLHLGIGFQQDLEPFLHPERGHEHFLLYLALDPVLVLGNLGFGETN